MNESTPGILLYFDDLRLINTLGAEDKNLILSSLEALEDGIPETPDNISDTGKVILRNIINKAMRAQDHYQKTQRRKAEGAFYGHILAENGKSKDQLTPEEERLFRQQASARYAEKEESARGMQRSPSGMQRSPSGYHGNIIQDNIKQDNINEHNISETSCSDEEDPDARTNKNFKLFWEKYPKHAKEAAARRAFFTINPDQETLSEMLTKIEIMSNTEAWKEQGGRFIPDPANWLTNEQWKDDPPKPRTKTVTEQRYDQRPNTENDAEGVPQWLLEIQKKGGGSTA